VPLRCTRRHVGSETSGDLKLVLLACLNGSEDEYDPGNVHTEDKAREDAIEFYKAGQGKFFGTDEHRFLQVLCSSPPQHLMEVNKQYAEEYGYTMSKAIEKELSGDAKDAALYLLGMKLNPGKTVAKLVKKACEGIGTDELLLTSTLIRYQRMLPEANDAFGRMYAETIQDCVSKEQGGNLGRLYARLLSICEEKTADPSE